MASNSSKRRAVERQSQQSVSTSETPEISPEARRAKIAEAAYFRSQQRAAAGAIADDIQDWLDAEKDIDQQIAAAPHAHHRHGDLRRD